MKFANNLDDAKVARENSPAAARRAASLLEETQIFQDYQKAFRKATGLPLAIRPIQSYENALAGQQDENEFCKLMGRTNVGCANCLKMQEDLEKQACLEPKSLHCFAGLCDTAVPIRVGDQLIAFLQTGQILLHQPNEQEFTQTTKQLLKWGSEVNLKHLEEAYFNTKVLDREQYQAMISLLSTFAEHLATISNSIAVEESDTDPMLVANAKKYIQDRYQDQLSLDDAAKAVNASTRHFCKVFKQATGITFTDYLSRVRVEKAKTMLANPNLRVSEIAFGVGFDSISQFNRSFKRITGQTPTEYRRIKARAG
ncbi:PocR ligand-binding domain-containing protein [Cerasicoccus maritimus]|uniref:PocR ligand-binding domain-containing protein n=1 Tax=Cerasicoccus maritimus TaxID=490089 RepID=UPI002852C5E0|nr:PocR ligand-binding domain-containing protein [Cerasicoccus maritimus]